VFEAPKRQPRLVGAGREGAGVLGLLGLLETARESDGLDDLAG
jgi:hypothetical protein